MKFETVTYGKDVFKDEEGFLKQESIDPSFLIVYSSTTFPLCQPPHQLNFNFGYLYLYL